jgi:hypothetical protein
MACVVPAACRRHAQTHFHLYIGDEHELGQKSWARVGLRIILGNGAVKFVLEHFIFSSSRDSKKFLIKA